MRRLSVAEKKFIAQQAVGGLIDSRWCSMAHVETLRRMSVGGSQEDLDLRSLTLYADSQINAQQVSHDSLVPGSSRVTLYRSTNS
jgi:hypothetical protein